MAVDGQWTDEKSVEIGFQREWERGKHELSGNDDAPLSSWISPDALDGGWQRVGVEEQSDDTA
jgi:hypothetical protein